MLGVWGAGCCPRGLGCPGGDPGLQQLRRVRRGGMCWVLVWAPAPSGIWGSPRVFWGAGEQDAARGGWGVAGRGVSVAPAAPQRGDSGGGDFLPKLP